MKYCALAVTVSCIFALSACDSTAPRTSEPPAKTTPAAAGQVSAKVGKPLKEAMDLSQAKKFTEALAKAREAQALPNKTPYEELKINEFIVYIASNLQDFVTATQAMEALLASGQLDAEQTKQRLDQLTKYYYGLKDYPKVIQSGERYLTQAGKNTEIALLVAQAYYLQKDYVHAATAIQNAIGIASQLGEPVKEDYLKLLMSSQMLAHKDADAMVTLEQLLARYPAQKYWNDMLNFELSQGGGSDRKRLEIYRLALATSVLKADEYVDMAQLSIGLGFPGDAKNILEKGLASKILGGANKDRETQLLTTAQTSAAADQKLLPENDREARAAAGGNADIKLGEAYASYGNYDKAIEAITRGLKKGNVQASDEAHLHLGLAYAGAKRNADAIAEFKLVPASSKLAKIARLWIIYVSGPCPSGNSGAC